MKLPKVIDKVTEHISAVADFAFAYMDTESSTIYLWGSDDRPLWVFDARELLFARRSLSIRQEILSHSPLSVE